MQFKIHHKLLIATLATNILVTASIYLFAMNAFDKSFKQYLDEAQAKRLQPMVTELAEIYKEKQNWDWIHHSRERLWSQLIKKHIQPVSRQINHRRPPGPGRPPPFEIFNPEIANKMAPRQPPEGSGVPNRPSPPFEPRFGPSGPPSGPPPGRGDPVEGPNDTMDIAPQILLANSDHKIVIGNPFVNPVWVPIKSENTIVGYLGFFRAIKLTSEIDNIFIDKLQATLGWILIAAVFLSVTISVLLAKMIVKPITILRNATKALSKGDYSSRIKHHSNDEIGFLSRGFNQLAKTLEQNLQSRQQLIADISHELRTPVAVLRAELEALQDGVRVLTDESVDSLHHEVLRLSHLINDLHQLSLSDLGSLNYKFDYINLVTIIEDVIDHKESNIRQKKIDLRFNSQANNIVVYGDYHRLIQLFYNLLNNSLSYTKDVGNISIGIILVEEHVIVKWCDSEPGVKDDDLSKLFDRLYRAEASRNRNTGGSGLGLAICENIAEAHNGSIQASHAELGGVCFTIRMPYKR